MELRARESRDRGPYTFGKLPVVGAGGGSIPASILTAPSVGTATADGCTGANVTTNQIGGTLYWAVVTNGGSCTDAQLIAGAGGNIVSGKAGNQAVVAPVKQTIADITGLTGSTTYQIKFLQVNNSTNSVQASVSLLI